MGSYSVEKISDIIKGRLKAGSENILIEYLLTDSRKVMHPGSSLFFALQGARRNGDSFIPDLYQRGIKNFVVDGTFAAENYPSANFIYVTDVLLALQILVTYYRSQFTIPIIGITGSNGKTIVKEWLNQLMEKEYSIVRSPKSYNSQIGVPLSVWQMNESNTLGIFEAGISQPGEMEALEKIIQPTIGVLTHIGDAHSENFTDIKQKIKEKLLLFSNADWIIANGDSPLIESAVIEAGIPCFFWGKNENATIKTGEISKGIKSTTIVLGVQAHNSKQKNSVAPPQYSSFVIHLPFTDDASIENAITCCSVLLCMGYSSEIIAERVQFLKPVEMRLEMKKGINNCSVINDSYITDISSLQIALEFLVQQQQHSKRTVILSDFVEKGKPAEKLYADIALSLQQKKISRFIGIGSDIKTNKDKFEKVCKETSFYDSTEEFIAKFHSVLFRDETILIKGARIFALERISILLEQKAHQTVLEINLNAILRNLRQYQQLLQPSTRIMAMVKAFSYGSGSYEIANILQFQKVDYLAVAYTDEGVELRKAGITLPIMVMNPEESSFTAMTENNLEPEIFSFHILNAFQQFLQGQGLQHYPVHIKVDTGMHRLGFELHETATLAEFLKDNHFISVQSVFSHLAGSEDPLLDSFTKWQAEQYIKACAILQDALPAPFIKHLVNSAGIIRHPSLHFDMIRLGIGLYGVDSAVSNTIELEEAATLKTTIAQIKKIKAGDTVGYSRKGKMEKDSIIATIRIGYADGYRRNLGNGAGKVLVNGKLAPVTGNIAMDMTMIDITDIPGVQEGDEVVLFGKGLSVIQLAQWAQTIPYEIMTGVSQRVQRVYFEE